MPIGAAAGGMAEARLSADFVVRRHGHDHSVGLRSNLWDRTHCPQLAIASVRGVGRIQSLSGGAKQTSAAIETAKKDAACIADARAQLHAVNAAGNALLYWCGVVLPVRIELTTSPLPRGCSTTELRQRP